MTPEAIITNFLQQLTGDYRVFLIKCFMILYHRDLTGKIGGLVFVSKPNQGKSLLLRLLLSIYSLTDIGIFKRAPENDKFWLQDLPGKQVYVSDECMLMDLQCDTIKMLLEGHDLLKVEKKNRDTMFLPRKPVIMAGNQPPWMYNPRHRDAILSRCYYYDFNSSVVSSDVCTQMYALSREQLCKYMNDMYKELINI